MAMGRYYQSKQFGEGPRRSPKAGHHKVCSAEAAIAEPHENQSLKRRPRTHGLRV